MSPASISPRTTPFIPTAAAIPNAAVRSIPDAPARPTTPHADALPANIAALLGGSAGKVWSETLDNGVRMIVAERPGAHSVKVQLGIGAGSLQDPQGKLGLAHLLEHLAFEGSPTRSAAKQQSTRRLMGENWNAYTDRDSVVFYGVAPNADAKRAASLLVDMFQHPNTSARRVEQERAAVINEMSFRAGSLADESWNITERLVFGTRPETNNISGTKASVNAITARDLKAYHQAYFTGRNTVALVEGDPAHLPLATLRSQLAKLPPGARVDNGSATLRHVPGQALQVVNDPSTHTVELNVMIPVATERVMGLKTPPRLITSALNRAFDDRLRRSQGLSYGVSARIEPGDESPDPATMLVRVNTRVAADKAQDALAGIVATVKDASNGLGEKTFARDKAGYRASIKMRESEPIATGDRAEFAFQDALQLPGVSIPPAAIPSMQQRTLNQLRTVSAADFARDAGVLLDMRNMKVLASGPIADGGAGLKHALQTGGIDVAKLAMNPVDLRYYRDAGSKVPAAKS